MNDPTIKEIISDAKTYEITETNAGKLAECPITTCQLKSSDCTADLSSNKITYDDSTGKVTAVQNEIAGYSQNFCL